MVDDCQSLVKMPSQWVLLQKMLQGKVPWWDSAPTVDLGWHRIQAEVVTSDFPVFEASCTRQNINKTEVEHRHMDC